MARTNTRPQHKQRAEYRADYAARFDDYASDDRFKEDHYWPVSTHAHLQVDPDNKRTSHAGCNRERGNGAPVVDLGIPSRQWA